MTSTMLRVAAAVSTALTAHTAINAAVLRRPRGAGADERNGGVDGRSVSVLIPARNEAHRIAACLRAVLASSWPDLQVLVLDDCSDDGTADVARAVAGDDPRVVVLDGEPPPPGWLGKPWACAQLAATATGDVLVFVDADVVIAPDAIAALVDLVDGGLDLACPYPRQLADGALPRLVQPLLQWSWLTFLPLALAERPGGTGASAALTAANGQLMACTREAYERAGGHMAVREAVLEDIALARAFKRAGLRAGVADGTTLASCRMYRSGRELADGYRKSLWAAFGSPAGALAAILLLGWLYVLPIVTLGRAVWRRDAATARLSGVAVAAGVAGRAIAALRTGGRAADAMAHPLSVTTLCWLVASSLRGHRRGTLTWKGRPLMRHDGIRRQRTAT